MDPWGIRNSVGALTSNDSHELSQNPQNSQNTLCKKTKVLPLASIVDRWNGIPHNRWTLGVTVDEPYPT